MKIYFCIVFAFFAMVLVKCEPPAEIGHDTKECAEKTGINITVPFEEPDMGNPKGNCFHACMMTKDGSVLVKFDDQTDPDKTFEECIKETGMTKESLKALRESNDPKAWCVNACMMKKKGVMVNGKAVADKVIEDITRDMPGNAKGSIKMNVPMCVDKANQEKDECAVFMVLRDCLIEKQIFSQ